MHLIRQIRGFLIILITFMALLVSGQADVHAQDVPTVIYNDICQYNGDPTQVQWLTDAICYASSQYQVDPLLVTAVMETESGFSFNSFSRAGAVGLMQLMPDTARMIGVDPYDPLQNVIGGASYLRTCLNDFSGWGEYSVTYAVAAYNAGPQAVLKYGGCPPYQETINYVYKVSDAYNRLLNTYYYQ